MFAFKVFFSVSISELIETLVVPARAFTTTLLLAALIFLAF